MKEAITELIKKIAKLIDLKSIITLALGATLIYGFIIGKVETKDFLLYVAMVITYYFNKKEDKGVD